MLQSEIYKKVAEEFNIPIERVIDYDKQMWNQIKISLNNPTFDTLEIPFFGSFNITKVKMGRTLRQSVIILRRLKAKAAKHPNNKKIQLDLEIQTKNFRNLWKLKQQCNFYR